MSETKGQGADNQLEPGRNISQIYNLMESLSVKDLTELIAAAENMRREKQQEAKSTMLAKWKAEAAEAGLTLDAVTAADSPVEPEKKERKVMKGNVPVKYRGPNGEEWSGRGRLPKWVQEAEAEGKSREEFRI